MTGSADGEKEAQLPSAFDAGEVEPRIYAAWEEGGCFCPSGQGDPYCIVIPPPNVTGALHMGHALNCTVQDILVRWHRMRGFDTLWQPGTDHAGIATQMVVERDLARQGGPSRRELGRDAFLEKVWSWKEQYGGTIAGQFRRLGASCDWSRERFTMDEGLSRAVREVFVRLYDEGLIYRDKRLVNWDPHFETAISDLEVEQVETMGSLWRFRYPLEDGSGHIEVATTRPETMLGDTAVAVHPEDPRHRGQIGKTLRLPLVGRPIPVVGDTHADPEVGSGAVKITPAHDFNDFAVAARARLPAIQIMDGRACMDLADNRSFLVGAVEGEELSAVLALDGLDRFEARKKVVEMMERGGFLAGVEEHVHMVPHGDRSKAPVEPHLTDQWFVDTADLAERALAAVKDGRTCFHPAQWETTYYRWLESIEPWCISRQLWWGHRIPVWYGPDGSPIAARSEEEAAAAAQERYGKPVELRQDEDVLDTWFSSALWPFSTLGWPDDTSELRRFYPTSVLVTAFDIIFFWVARMMMAGLHFMKDEEGREQVPFHDVYVHAIVRDEQGRKMSKSLGNVLNPLDLVDQYGADAVRFTLASMAAQGRDIRLSSSRIEGSRNFVSKLWNAARFVDLQSADCPKGFDPSTARSPINRWIAGRLKSLAKEVDAALTGYRFDEAARAIYSTVWGVFCDWYIEFSKDLISHGDDETVRETKATLAWARDRILLLAHPIMPFVTEEIWQRRGEDRPTQLAQASWPEGEEAEEIGEVDWLVRLIEEARSVRSELGVPASAKVPMMVVAEEKEFAERIERYTAMVQRQVRLESLACVDAPPSGSVSVTLEGATAHLMLGGVIDVPAERARLQASAEDLAAKAENLQKRLDNPEFQGKAPPEVVEETRRRLEDMELQKSRVMVSLQRLEASAIAGERETAS